MLADADSIDDLQVIRSGGSKKLFGAVYAPATLGMFLREFTHGHTRQLGAVLTRHLVALTGRTAVLAGIEQQAYVDIDSLLRPVYGHAKQGASFGHTKIANRQVLRKGLSPLACTISTATTAPVIAGVRLRAGKAGSGRGAASMVTEAINTAIAAGAHPSNILVRGDSAYGYSDVISAVVKAASGFQACNNLTESVLPIRVYPVLSKPIIAGQKALSSFPRQPGNPLRPLIESRSVGSGIEGSGQSHHLWGGGRGLVWA